MGVFVSGAGAVPIVISLDPSDFDDLGVTGTAGAYMANAYSTPSAGGGDWTGTVYSQAFTLDSGEYLYLYQVANDGPDVLELVVVNPFTGLDPNRTGYVNSNEPAGFLSGGHVRGGSYDPAVLNLSYQYPSGFGWYIPSGEHTAPLYVISPYGPKIGNAWLLDTGSYMADVWVDVPEPVSAAVMAVGCVVLMLRRKRRR